MITPLILTYNEAPNIGRVLERLTWAPRIVVIDSGSTDETLNILGGYANVEVTHRPFDNHKMQWSFELDCVDTPWVLALDADYVLSTELIDEFQQLEPGADGYVTQFRYCIDGRPLRGSLYPSRIVLFRKQKAHFIQDGHTQRLVVDGEIRPLNGIIYHDDRKPLSRWLDNQRRYAALEAEKLLAADPSTLSRVDRLRRRRLAPLLVPFYCLFAKGLILDGAAGWRYTLERTYAEVLLALELTERARTLASTPQHEHPQA